MVTSTVALDAVVIVPTTSSAFVIAVVAAACVRVTTLGTLIGGMVIAMYLPIFKIGQAV